MTVSLTLSEATSALKDGGLIAYPTEAVWGLGCDPVNENAVRRLLAVKQRDIDKGLILVAANLDQLRSFLDLPALPGERLAQVLATWPGPHTWAMPAHHRAPRWITGAHDSIAVRISAHPVVVALCMAFGGPLVSTSANRAGAVAARTRNELDPALSALIDGITAGETEGLLRPTPIHDARTGAELRA